MLGVSGLMGSSGDGAAAVGEAHESGGASGGSSEVGASSSMPGGGMEESGGGGGGGGVGGGGNRWPRQETLALLKIRSDMDATFRDASLKGPLWEEVSRKMSELGFQRSSKKCKEKFENVYKYHKRTKDGRASKSDGKTYRFFDQLEAFENTPPPPYTPPPPRSTAPTMTAAPPPPPRNTTAAATSLPMPPPHVTVSSISPNPISEIRPTQAPTTISPIINPTPFQTSQPQPINFSNPNLLQANFMSTSTSSSSSTSSDEDIQRRRGKKRKWKDFFQRLMKDVIHKQEELQKKFLDTLERRERDRVEREEAWRVQEMARMNRVHELLVQERSIAEAKDAAVISFLQKVTDQHSLQIPISNITPPPPPPQPQVSMQVQPTVNPQPAAPPPPAQQSSSTLPQLPKPIPATPPPPVVAAKPMKVSETSRTTDNSGGGGDNTISGAASSSRWPKTEVQALIKLRTNLDLKYQESGPKGPLWEEISAAMAKLGYNRSSKRCKEKWENINKYFKKVKESSKKRPEDSKTCPYFHQLDAIYRERAKHDLGSFNPGGFQIKPENPMVPIMARPEQQWPLAAAEPQPQPQPPPPAMPDHHHEDDDDSDNNDHEDDDDEEDEGEGYEIVANKQQQSTSATNAAE